MRTFGLLALALAGCTSGDKGVSTGGPSGGTPSTGTGAATGTGTGATSATGTGTGTGTGSSSTGAEDGQYVGTIDGTIEYQPSPNGPLLLLYCTGTVDIAVQASAPVPIDGTGTCSSAYDVFDVVITGQIPSPGAGQGQLEFQHPSYGFQDGWTGSFAGDTFTGSSVGNSGGGYPYKAWAVSWTADR